MKIVEEKPLVELNREAIRLLYKELGAVNAIRFLGQFSEGKGDSIREKDEQFGHMTFDDVVREIKKDRAKRAKGAQR